jgi:hypothetical protein
LDTRFQRRKIAYRYITELSKNLNRSLLYKSDRVLDDICYVSLNDLEELKEGLSDPSQELIFLVKKLFSDVASENEIDNYLIKPFVHKTLISLTILQDYIRRDIYTNTW